MNVPSLSPATWFHETFTQVGDVICGLEGEADWLAYMTSIHDFDPMVDIMAPVASHPI